MKIFIAITCVVILVTTGQLIYAQDITNISPNPELLKKRWLAEWITHPNMSLSDFSVLFFRKSFELNNLHRLL
jgi:hypothetical protein